MKQRLSLYVMCTFFSMFYMYADNNPVLEIFNKGVLHTYQQEFDKAIPCFMHVIKSNPEIISASYNLAWIFRRIGRYHEAISLYKNVVTLQPDHDDAFFGLANAYLILGDFENGLIAYERGRSKTAQVSDRLQSLKDVAGKTVLIVEEWGIGDTFQFIRYAALLKEAGAVQVTLAVRDALKPLMRLCPYIDNVISKEEAFSYQVNYRIPMMSLMYVCQTRIEFIPNKVPYLKADEHLIQYWATQLKQNGILKIGINWRGSHASTGKDIPAQLLFELSKIPNVQLYNVQHNGTQEIQQHAQCNIIDFGSTFDTDHGAFMDTAALMQNLDLIISSDTSIAHLAGALGKSVWMIIPYYADWRWFLNNSDSPWYPTMKIFRQPSLGDWHGAVQMLKGELVNLQHKVLLK